jgi:hypothetical protein
MIYDGEMISVISVSVQVITITAHGFHVLRFANLFLLSLIKVFYLRRVSLKAFEHLKPTLVLLATLYSYLK